MEKTKEKTKEELLKAIKKAKEHKEQALIRTAKEWKREGIKGKVVLCRKTTSRSGPIWAYTTA